MDPFFLIEIYIKNNFKNMLIIKQIILEIYKFNFKNIKNFKYKLKVIYKIYSLNYY